MNDTTQDPSLLFDMTVQKALYELLRICADWADDDQINECLDEINRREARIREKRRSNRMK